MMLSRLATASAPKKNARGIISRPHQLWRVTGDEHVARDGLGVSLLDVFVDTVHQQQHHRLAQGVSSARDDRCDGNAQGQGRPKRPLPALHGKRYAQDSAGNRIGRVIGADRDGADHGKLHRGAHDRTGHYIAHDKANQRSEHNRALEVARARQPLGIAQKGDQENQDCLDNHDSP